MKNQSNTPSFLSYCLTLLFLAFLPMSFSYADDERQYMGMGYGHMGMGHGHMGSGLMGTRYRFMDSLDLTTEQRTTIRNIHKESRNQQLDLQDKIAEHKDKLYSLFKEDKPDEKKVGDVYKKIFSLKQQKIELAIKTKNKTYDILNKKQRKKLKELKSSESNYRDMHGDMHDGMHHMMR